MELTEKLAQLRKMRGLTQEQLAEELHVSRTAVSKWENGRGVPSIDSLQALAEFFGVTVDELLGGEAGIGADAGKAQVERGRQAQVFSAWLGVAALACAALPLYKLRVGEAFASVPLYQVETGAALVFALGQIAMAVCGVAALVALGRGSQRRVTALLAASDVLCGLLVVAFALTSQPYPTCAFVVLLVLKMIARIGFSQVRCA